LRSGQPFPWSIIEKLKKKDKFTNVKVTLTCLIRQVYLFFHMKRNNYILQLAILFLLVFGNVNGFSQVTVVSSNDISCSVLTSTLTATKIGDSPTDAGITTDDIYSPPIAIGFPFMFYGTSYTQCVIGANGTIGFNTSLAGSFDPYGVAAALLGNTNKLNSICGPWCDIDIFYTGSPVGTETYSTSGVAPNRKFAVTWCGCSMFSCGTQLITTQIILYEGSNEIDVHITRKEICTGWYSGHAIVGVQNAAGTAATTAPGRDFPSVWAVPPTEAWHFTPNVTSTAYTCTSIPYAPIPFASSPIIWYTPSGTYLGTGTTTTVSPTVMTSTIVVAPTTTTTYKAGAAGCADTSWGYVTVNVSPILVITPATTDPSLCGACDGSITLNGMTPGNIDTINYSKDGVPQPAVIATVSGSGTITLNGLCSGAYTNITVRQGACLSAAVTATLTDPPIAISGGTPHAVSYCGQCDGKLVLHGLYPTHAFTVSYSFNSIPQTPLVTVSDASGDITINNLCAGDYSNIIATFGACTTPPAGPFTVDAPPTNPGRIIDTLSPSQCGFSDGKIYIKGLPPLTSDTVSYSLNGIIQPSVITAALSDSSIILAGLVAGNYSTISVKIGQCIYNIIGIATLIKRPLTAGFTDEIHLGCLADTVKFTNTSLNVGPLYYVWSFGDGLTDTSKNPVHLYHQGSYTVTLIATNYACVDSAKASFNLDHPLSAAFTATPTLLCQGSTVTFANSSVGGVSYQWNFGNGAMSGTSDATYTYNNQGQYNAQLIVTDALGCQDTAYAPITVDTTSGAMANITDSTFCTGSYATFTGLYASIGNTGVTWAVLGPAGTIDSIRDKNPLTYAFPAMGSYTVMVTPHYRICKDPTTSRVITILPTPVISMLSDTSICAGSEVITLHDNLNDGTAGASWTWSTGSHTSSAVIAAPGKYYVTVNIHNCTSTDTINVTSDCYMNIPNAFTPNNDGVNDYFFPRNLLTRGLTSFGMQIYNRWGQLIFETNSLTGAGWDGKMNGANQPEGVFVYVIDATFRDGQKEHHQGNVTLLR
jgi:gliding motility-associated-like protein